MNILGVSMKREFSNKIRLIMEDFIPFFIRDNKAFAWIMDCFYPLVREFSDFRCRAHNMDEVEYNSIYRKISRIHEGTDNSNALLAEIMKNIEFGKIVDVGCGTGYVLDFIKKNIPNNLSSFTGIDFQIDSNMLVEMPEVNFIEHDILELPFADSYFDTVICTHTIEHILDIRAVILELRRICAKRLIIVVPREREGLYTFNPHLHFFPYVHSFLRVMIPLKNRYDCIDIGRDILYIEYMM